MFTRSILASRPRFQRAALDIPAFFNTLLEPHDLAAAKCQVGREKDIALMVAVVRAGLVDWNLVKERMLGVEMDPNLTVRADLKWKEVAAKLKD